MHVFRCTTLPLWCPLRSEVVRYPATGVTDIVMGHRVVTRD